MYLDCEYSNYLCGCLRKYFVLVCVILWKICRFKCGNHNKIENLFKKNSRISLGSYQNRGQKWVYGLDSYHNRGQRSYEIFNFKKKYWTPMASVLPYPRQKTNSMASGDNRGQRGCLLASPQKPSLHWWTHIWII